MANTEIINNYEDFKAYNERMKDASSLFFVIEYSPESLGYNSYDDNQYKISTERYSLMRNECLKYPQSYNMRLDNHIYRIWTTIPKEITW